MSTCPRCGHTSAASWVAEALWLRGERERLDARLTWVEQQIAAGNLIPSPVVPPAGTGIAHPAQPAAPSSAQRPITAQGLLLGGGALLLVVAAIVFTAVAWNRIGPAGQVLTMLGVIAVLGGTSHLMRRRYRSTAEALATASAAVTAVALLAAPQLGLGADWMRTREAAWASLALIATAALAAVMSRLGGLVAWRVATVIALGGSAVAATFAVGAPEDGPQPLAVALLALAATVLLVWSGRTASAPAEALYLGVALGGLSVMFSLRDLDAAPIWILTWAVIAGGAGVVAIAPAVAQPRRAVPAVVPEAMSGLAALVAGLAVAQAATRAVVAGIDSPELALLLLGGLGAVVFAAGALGSRRLAGAQRRGLWLACLAGSIAAWLLAFMAADRIISAAALAAVSDYTPLAVEAVAGFFAIIAVTLVGVGLLLRRTWPLAATWLPWGGALAAIVAVWVLLGDRDVEVLEAYTLPAAGLLLVAGGLSVWAGRARGPASVHGAPGPGPAAGGDLSGAAHGLWGAPSLWLIGPALAVALVPSAVATWPDLDDRHRLLRTVVVLLVAAGCAVVGGLGRVKAPLLVGLAALLIVAVGQVLVLADMVPRWVTLTVAAVVLLAAGFSLEELTRRGRQVRRAVHEFR